MIWFLVIGISVLVILSLWWWHNVTRPYQHIAAFHYTLPIVGNTFRLPLDPTKIIPLWFDLFDEIKGKTGVFWLFGRANVFSIDVDHYESILKSNALIAKGQEYDLFRSWLGDGLLLSNGKKWKTRRHLLTPAFHFNILAYFADIMNIHAMQFVSHLKNNASGSLLEFSSLTKNFSLDLLCETTMGIRQNSFSAAEGSKEKNYVESINVLLHILSDRFRKPWFYSETMLKLFYSKYEQYYKALHYAKSFTKNVVEDRIKLLEGKEDIDAKIFLDILIGAYKRNEIDIEGILDEVNTFMFEGHDTVSTALSWIVYLTGRDKRVQEKVSEEVLKFPYEEVTAENISELNYLECVIKEGLRLHPSASVFFRKIENDTVLESGLKLPANTQFFFMIYHMHRNESYWKNASSFIPERFQEEEFKTRNPFSYIPFSAGPRNCIGQRYAMMELKIVMFYLIRNFLFESTQEEKDLGEHIDAIHRAENGIWVKIYKR